MINVRNANDICVVNNRYAIIRDFNGDYRVVSLVRTPYRELQPRHGSSGMSYAFNRTGTSSVWNKTNYSQGQLATMFTRHGVQPKPSVLADLQTHGAIKLHNAAGAQGNIDLSGMPYNNNQLDPVNGGWVIATVTTDGLLFGTKPKVHRNQDAAEAELQRLATVSPGTEFVLLKATKAAITQTVQTRNFA